MNDRTPCPHCDGLGYLTAENATIGDMIKSHRKKLGKTQLWLAQEVGVSRTQVANIEVGRSDPQVSQLRRYAAALQCSLKDLVP